MEMLRLFGTNDTSIGKFQPLPKVARLTVMLSDATVNNMGVSKMDFVVYKSEADNTGRLVELVHNKHCEVYEVVVDGIPVFNCTDYLIAEHEYNMECV